MLVHTDMASPHLHHAGNGAQKEKYLKKVIAGELISLTSMVNPAYSYVVLFVVMTLVLMFRPRGLLGAVGRE